MKTYDVVAKRAGRYWELHIDGVGVTQARKLRQADEMACDLIERRTGEAPGTFSIRLVPDLGGLEKDAALAREHTARAQEQESIAAAESRAVVKRLREEGLSGDDAAVVLGVSKSRVSQLAKRDDGAGRNHQAAARA